MKSTITIGGHTHAVPAGFDLPALIAAVKAGSDREFRLTLPPSPRHVRNRRLVFTAADVDVIKAYGLADAAVAA